jgi:hypothetical protein
MKVSRGPAVPAVAAAHQRPLQGTPGSPFSAAMARRCCSTSASFRSGVVTASFEVAHEVRFGHGRQLVKGGLPQPRMMTPVEPGTCIGRAAQFLQCAVLVSGNCRGVPVVPPSPGSPEEQHPGHNPNVHGQR